ncbi:MAG: hypothetical protein KBS85_05950 [Lachnospiraceae bacterium]|nr:hypothetical protein [Candidatus Merdinaster equi]
MKKHELIRKISRIMAGVFAAVTVFASVSTVVKADVIYEPYNDDFYKKYHAECEYVNEKYCINGPRGVVQLFKSPIEDEVITVLDNGLNVRVEYSYVDDFGTKWAQIDSVAEGWFPMEYADKVYSSDDFWNDHYKEISYEGDFAAPGKGTMTVLYYSFPGDVNCYENEVDFGDVEIDSFFTDDCGHNWGHLYYEHYGAPDYWVCFDNPNATYEELYPNGTGLFHYEMTEKTYSDEDIHPGKRGSGDSNGEDNKGNSNGHFADNTVEMNGIDPMLIWVAGGSVVFIATITTGLLVLLKSFRKKEEQKRSGNK